MARDSHSSERIVIVGGGVAGVSAAVRLAQAGLPVTVLEASQLGFAASTRNQGWLHSGGVFAREHPELARICHQSLGQTLAFCPECVEPGHDGMAYVISKPDTLAAPWSKAWSAAGIGWKEVDVETFLGAVPGYDRGQVQHAYLLPDRAIRSDVLLERLAGTARNAGAEIRSETSVTSLKVDGSSVGGIVTGSGEEIAARLVVLAGGALGLPLWSQVAAARAGKQVDYSIVPLKTHLVALRPEVGRLPFCVVDAGGFNHVPHQATSVFASNRWMATVKFADQSADPAELNRLWECIAHFFPQLKRAEHEVLEWAGTTVQAMHLEQVEPGQAPLPTVIDHASETPGYANLLSIVPGRASLWPYLAEQTRRLVLEKIKRDPVSTAKPPWAVEP